MAHTVIITKFYFERCLKDNFQAAFLFIMNTILLASNSPRRYEILSNLGYSVQTCAANIDETPHPNESAKDYVLRLAIEKNRSVRTQLSGSPQTIISADTSVVLNDQILGKPHSPEHATQMLQALSGKTHQVLTAVCVSHNGQEFAQVQTNQVQFKSLSNAEIAAYIATGEPTDKAGAYGIQGIGGIFVVNLSGSFTGVMGLPVFETIQLLQRCGVATPPFSGSPK